MTYEVSRFDSKEYNLAKESVKNAFLRFCPYQDKDWLSQDVCNFYINNDTERGYLYSTLPKLNSVKSLCVSKTILETLEELSGLNGSSFVCENINVRLDFPNIKIKKQHNLSYHQDFHYSNKFVTMKNSFVIWAPFIPLNEVSGGLKFISDIQNIDGAIKHDESKREEKLSRWFIKSNNLEKKMKQIFISEGDFICFDMRHPHASADNNNEFLPRITLQARYSSFEEDDFLKYHLELPK